MKTKQRPPVAVFAAAVLLCLVLVSMSMTSGVFARYTVKAEKPDDSPARAAAFNVSAEADADDAVSIIANGTDDSGRAEYLVKVKNSGETAVEYEAEVVFTGSEGDHDSEKFDDDENNNLTFTGYLAPDEEAQKTVTFDMSEYFDVNDKWNTFSNDDISGESGKVPFNVNVKFTQVD